MEFCVRRIICILFSLLGVVSLAFAEDELLRIGRLSEISNNACYELVFDGAHYIENTDDGTRQAVERPKSYQLNFKNGVFQLMELGKIKPRNLRFLLAQETTLSVNGKRYSRGVAFSQRQNGQIVPIELISLDDYIKSVLPKEIGASAPAEALKAQAVAARSYCLSHLEHHQNDNYDLCDTTHCQVYGGYEVRADSTDEAVSATKNQVLLYDNKAIEALYSASSGGYTADAEFVYGSKMPYLISFADPYSDGENATPWSYELTLNEINTKINNAGKNIGNIVAIKADYADDSGRVKALNFKGSNGDFAIKGSKIRTFFAYGKVKSLLFDIEDVSTQSDVSIISAEGLDKNDISSFYVQSAKKLEKLDETPYIKSSNVVAKIKQEKLKDKIKFVGKGYGHGLGMSQRGAMEMAKQGKTYTEILEFYYPNTELSDEY